MSLILQVERMEASVPLVDVPRYSLEEYLQDAVPGAERVDVLMEHENLGLLFRIVYQGKHVLFRLNLDDNVLMFRFTVDKALDRLQEELDKEPEVISGYEPPPPYTPKAWAEKVAEKAKEYRRYK